MTDRSIAGAPSAAPQAGSMLESWVRQETRYGLVFMDAQGCVTGLSPAAQQILGYSLADLVGRPIATFFTRGDQALQLPLHEMEVATRIGYSEDDRWHRRKDGSLVWIGGALTRVTDGQGELWGFVKIMRDRSDYRIQVEALKAQVEALEQQLQAARLGQRPAPPPARALRLSAVQLQELLQDAVRTCLAAAQSAGVALELLVPLGPIELQADAVALRQGVLRLVGNAIRFTPRGGQVWVQATLEGETAVIRVEDTGVGLDGRMLGQVGAWFTQAPKNAQLPAQKPGAGLRDACDLVRAHGGSMEARSDGPGQGSNFVVRLPVTGPRVG